MFDFDYKVQFISLCCRLLHELYCKWKILYKAQIKDFWVKEFRNLHGMYVNVYFIYVFFSFYLENNLYIFVGQTILQLFLFISICIFPS